MFPAFSTLYSNTLHHIFTLYNKTFVSRPLSLLCEHTLRSVLDLPIFRLLHSVVLDTLAVVLAVPGSVVEALVYVLAAFLTFA